MKNIRTFSRHGFAVMNTARAVAAAVSMLSLCSLATAAPAGAAAKSGQEVVEAVCAGCHAIGKLGAPKIGDKNAWSARAALGLTALTKEALKGIRQMPSHGGNPSLSDSEIERAIIFMVNKSGGNWIEPINVAKPNNDRSGAEIVKLQCSKCHQEGKGGAPRIGDRAAWTPRLTHGIDATVHSAINGHGGMPSRGGMPNLTDGEVRNAILYMFNPPRAKPAAK